MNMIFIPSYNDWIAFKVSAYTTQIPKQFMLNPFVNEGIALLGAKYNMYVVPYE